jgi:site-specific DNA-adenine methylase
MGSKRLLKPRILPVLASLTDGVREYRECFAGSAQVGITMMSYRPDLRHWWNDRDPCIAAIWLAVLREPEAIIERIERLGRPTVAVFG